MEVHHEGARRDGKRETAAEGRQEALRDVAGEELRNEIRSKLENLIGAEALAKMTKTQRGLSVAPADVLGKFKEHIDELLAVKKDERTGEWKRGCDQATYALEQVGRHMELHLGSAEEYIALAKAAPREFAPRLDPNLDRDLPSVREKLSGMDQTELEYLVANYMAANGSGKYTALLEKAGEEWISRFKGRLDLHAICHLFEKYNRGEIGGLSLLDFEANEGLMRTLYIAAMRQVAEGGESYNMERIVRPVAEFNRDCLTPENLDKPFAWKPEGLDYGTLAAKMDPKYYAAAIAFCHSNTPREFLRGLVNSGQPITHDSYDQAKVLGLLESLSELDEKTLKDFFIKIHTGCESLSQLRNAVSNPPTVPLPGLFVDIGNTLVGEDELWGLDTNIASLRPEVVEYMRRFRAEGKPVVVFTGGDPESSTEKLLKLGLDEAFLPVHPKHHYKGKLLETLIDDTRAIEQGFTAQRQATVVWIDGQEFGDRRQAFFLDDIEELPRPEQD